MSSFQAPKSVQTDSKSKGTLVDYTRPLSISSEEEETDAQLEQELQSNGASSETTFVVQRAVAKK